MADISVTNTSSDLSAKTLVTAEGDRTITGALTFDRDPNAPFVVASGSAVVTNLDADKLDGQEGSYYLAFSNATGDVDLPTQVTGNLPLANLGTFVGTTYTPTWTNDGTANTLGTGTLTGSYLQVGKLVLFRLNFTFGGTTSSGSGNWIFSLPVTAEGSGAQVNDAIMVDSSTSATYRGFVGNVTTSTIAIYSNGSGSLARVTGTAPFTWASGDALMVRGWYFAA